MDRVSCWFLDLWILQTVGRVLSLDHTVTQSPTLLSAVVHLYCHPSHQQVMGNLHIRVVRISLGLASFSLPLFFAGFSCQGPTSGC